MKNYRIYSKNIGQNRFCPVDWIEGVQVVNLIYATIITSEFLEKAKHVLSESVKMNEGMVFQLREIDTGKTIFEAK